jgi:hypothetical protein
MSLLGQWANNIALEPEPPTYPAYVIAYADGSGYLLSVHPAEARECPGCHTMSCLLIVRETGTPGVRTVMCTACDEGA